MWNGIYKPRDWQREALPEIVKAIKSGKRPVVSAIMGSGKSVLIAELCALALEKLQPGRHIVVAAPRQSLVVQLSNTIEARTGVGTVGTYYTYSKQSDRSIIVCCNASAIGLADALAGRKVAMLVGDEVHGTESETLKMAFESLAPACAVGFTATPYRSSDKETLTLWDEIAYKYEAGDALRDKVIVPWTLAHWDGEGCSAEDVDEVCYQMISEFCFDEMNDREDGFPGIVSATDIDDATAFAAYIEARSHEKLRAAAVHSRMPRGKREQVLRRLERGDLHVVVHVSLLAEGVDMPWLRWICLRRPVQAKVRFVQEVGRVLRAYPGKEEALILDPHDLFGQHGLVHPEAIGEGLLPPDPDEEELASLIKEEEVRERVKSMPPAKAMTAVESWVRELLVELRTHKIVHESHLMPHIREVLEQRPASDKQMEHIEKLLWTKKYLPEEFRPQLVDVINSGKLTGAMACDLLDMFHALREKSKAQRMASRGKWARVPDWKLPEEVRLPQPVAPVQGLLFRAGMEKK